MTSNVTSSPSLRTQASVWLRSIPLVTRGVLLLCSSIYLFELLFGAIHHEVCQNPYKETSQYEVYRMFSSPWFHIGIFHILLNMMSFVPMGAVLERSIGSLYFLYMIMLFSLLTGLVHISVAFMMAYNPIYHSRDFIYECAVGFSGLIFAFLTINSNKDSSNTRSLFGFVTVPAKIYPFILLVALQFLMPAVSFVGHLAGIIVGYAYSFGLLTRIFPSAAKFNSAESSSALGWLVRFDGYIANTNSSDLLTNSGINLSGILPTLRTQQSTQHFSGSGHTLASNTSFQSPHVTRHSSPPQTKQTSVSPLVDTPTIAQLPSNQPDNKFPGAGQVLGKN